MKNNDPNRLVAVVDHTTIQVVECVLVWYACPECNCDIQSGSNYCNNCGVELYWKL